MHRKWQFTRIRMIDTPPQGGSQNPGESETEKQQESQEPTDWQAKYEDAIKHSRTWETRAKDNSKAAEELKQLKESSMSDAQKAEAHTKELEAKVAAYEQEKQSRTWAQQVSNDTGVPADILQGNSLEDMQEQAKKINSYLHPGTGGSKVPHPGRTPEHKPNDSKQQQLDALAEMFGETK